MQPQTVLVTAASGHIGSELIPQLLESHVKLVLPTTNAARLQSSLPASATEDNVAVEEGSFKDPDWLEDVMTEHDVDTVFLCLTGTDELMVTLNFFDVMQRVKTVKHLVYLSACGDFASDEGFRNVVTIHSAMHVLVKPLIERKLLYSGYPWTTTRLGPTLFWDNDLRSKESMLQDGFFDEPLSYYNSRVSAEDIATVARKAIIEKERWAGKKIMVGSKKRYTGAEIENLWSNAIGKQVKMCGGDAEGLQHFEDGFHEKASSGGFYQADAKMWARDLRLMYETFTKNEFGMTDADYKLQCQCLGREPYDYEQFVRETGRSWVA